MIRHLSTAFLLTGLLALSATARAQDSQPPEASVKADSTTQPTTSGAATGAAKPDNGASPQGRALTKEQLATFSRMVRQSKAAVAARVESDAAARDLVLRAVEARESRRGTGRSMIIGGASLLVISSVAWGYTVFWGLPRDDFGNDAQSQIDSNRRRLQWGVGVSVVSAAVGLALGIPGVVKLARTGDVERQAIEDYRDAEASSIERPLPPARPITRAGSSSAPRAALVLPVVSLSF